MMALGLNDDMRNGAISRCRLVVEVEVVMEVVAWCGGGNCGSNVLLMGRGVCVTRGMLVVEEVCANIGAAVMGSVVRSGADAVGEAAWGDGSLITSSSERSCGVDWSVVAPTLSNDEVMRPGEVVGAKSMVMVGVSSIISGDNKRSTSLELVMGRRSILSVSVMESILSDSVMASTTSISSDSGDVSMLWSDWVVRRPSSLSRVLGRWAELLSCGEGCPDCSTSSCGDWLCMFDEVGL